MTALNASSPRGASSLGPTSAPAASSDASAAPSLLPPASTDGVDATGSSLLRLYTLLVARRSTSTGEKESELAVQKHLEDVQIEDQTKARIEEGKSEQGGGFFDSIGSFFDHAATDVMRGQFDRVEKDFDKDIVDNPQFWKDLERGAAEIGTWAAVAGSIVLAAATAGAGTGVAVLVISGAVLSTAGALQSDLHVLEKVGVDSQSAAWVGLGLSIGGAAFSGAGGMIAAGQAVYAAGAEHALRVAGVVANAGSGASSVVAGAAHIEVATFEERASLAQIDQKRAEFNIEHIEARTQRILDSLKQYYESSASNLAALSKAQEHHDRTLMGLASTRV